MNRIPGCSALLVAACSVVAPHHPVAVAGNQVVWTYEVVDTARHDLLIEATFAAGSASRFGLDESAIDFVQDVQVARERDWMPAARSGTNWVVRCDSGCRVRYRFALRQAADQLADINTAVASGDAIIAPPSTWLLHPRSPGPGSRLTMRIRTEGDNRFLTALRRAPDSASDSYTADTSVVDVLGFAAFGRLAVDSVIAGNSTLEVGIARERLMLSQREVIDWVTASTNAVASYYGGRLPASSALVLIMNGGQGPTRGETLAGGGPTILLRVGEGVNGTNTRDDWVLAHELLHVNFPDLGREHAWFTEGLATYIEPVARVRVGLLPVTTFWHDLIEGLPQGLPEKGDLGLEKTHTWGRTYWGGALFFLCADVAIRERTSNAHSLDDVLLEVARTGATVENHWEIGRILEVAAHATGTQVLSELFDRMALKPGTVDLDQLFARLGVTLRNGSLVVSETAPLAAIRRSLTAQR